MRLFKRAACSAVFLFLLLVLLSVLSWLVAPEKITLTDWVDGRDRNAFSVINEPENSIDVLVMGDSESFTSISPYRLWERQKITSYVCGQTGQHVIEAYNMLKNAYRSQNPKLVILETNELFTCAGVVEEGRLALTKMGERYLPVFYYHNRWKDLTGSDRPVVMMADEKSYKGFEIRKGCKPYDGGKYMKEGEMAQSMSPSVSLYLGMIKRLCDEHGSQLLLVSIPSPKNWSCSKHQGVKQYAQKNSIPFLDLNEAAASGELLLDWQQDSYDHGDHLNLSGAEKVTDYLGNYLEEHFDFRGNSFSGMDSDVLDSWKQGLADYKKAAGAGGNV